MGGLLSFLLFGAFFFLMMRFGCGAHAGHGGHGDEHGDEHQGHAGAHGAAAQGDLTAGVDPVCGMRVDADMGYAKVYRGTTYRLCSRDCLDKFEADPDRYASTQQPPAGAMGHVHEHEEHRS